MKMPNIPIDISNEIVDSTRGIVEILIWNKVLVRVDRKLLNYVKEELFMEIDTMY